jgi:hypothetical protein
LVVQPTNRIGSDCLNFLHPNQAISGNERRTDGLFRHHLCLTIPNRR